jgi:hypothetical protein
LLVGWFTVVTKSRIGFWHTTIITTPSYALSTSASSQVNSEVAVNLPAESAVGLRATKLFSTGPLKRLLVEQPWSISVNSGGTFSQMFCFVLFVLHFSAPVTTEQFDLQDHLHYGRASQLDAAYWHISCDRRQRAGWYQSRLPSL